jgi:hypothetical protein
MRFLALLLFTPPFLILAWLYWSFPRALPRTPARRRFDVAVLLASAAATVLALLLANAAAPAPGAGPIWRQVLATLAVYHTFPLLLAAAWFVRARRFRSM